jgi:parallel beta-helix repeat protein
MLLIYSLMRRKVAAICVSLTILLQGVIFIIGFIPNVSGAIIYVDDDGGADFTKIQDALDAANDGDTIYVYSGTYYENLRVEKSIILTGQSRANTIIEGSNTTYVIYIVIDNVEISGFQITGNNGTNYAGIASSRDNIMVTHCEFIYNGKGVHFGGSSFHTVKNNICRNNVRDGISLHGCDNVTLEDNQCLSNGDNGIHVHGDVDFIIKNNICNNNERDGMYLHGRSNTIVENNQCNDNGYFGIHGHGMFNITVNDNICQNNYYDGIFMHGVFDSFIRDNQCNFNRHSGIWGFGGEDALIRSNNCNENGVGIRISGVKYCTIEQNTCSDNGKGVEVYWDDNYTIANNNLNSNSLGIYIYSMSNGVIENNMINNNLGGIRTQSCSDLRVSNNSCDNNGYGIYFHNYADRHVVTNNSFNSNQVGLNMYRSNNNTFSKNDFSENDQGIIIWYFSKYNIFSNNTISDNQLIWISLDYWWRPESNNTSTHNLFYHNNIINNTEQTNSSIPSDNHWHHPILLEGNYWSDYTGLDDGSGVGKHAIAGDGIGDTEIPHPGFGFDFYPFINENGWDDIPNLPPTADAGVDQTVHIWETVQFDGSNSSDPEGDNLTYAWDFGDGSPLDYGVNVTHVYNTTGIYNVTLTVTDEGGLSDTDNCIITVMYPPSSPPFPFSMTLTEGWNLISIPTIQADPQFMNVLIDIEGKYDAIQWYDVADEHDLWKHYEVEKPYGNDLLDINETMGFWIHIIHPGVTIFNYNGTQPTGIQKINLYPGWNQVGYPSNTNRIRYEGLNNLEFGIDIDSIQWFNSTTITWHDLGPGDSFEIGKGYWIHSRVETIWEVPIEAS